MKLFSHAINPTHRYLIKRNVDGEYIGSTNDLGLRLPPGHIHVDTVGDDGLGTMNGNRGIPDFLRAKREGVAP